VALKGIVSEINNELYGQGFEVAGWHLNGALEPLDNWFTDNGWGEPETPATDRIVAEIKADGVALVKSAFEEHIQSPSCYQDEVIGMESARSIASQVESQLREGADK
jgi:hypothetical protein